MTRDGYDALAIAIAEGTALAMPALLLPHDLHRDGAPIWPLHITAPRVA